jgi:WD40 repeat protein
LVDYKLSDKGTKKASTVYVSSQDGLLYFVNYSTRQVDKIIQIHEDSITTLMIGPNRNFIVTASINGVLRLWSPDFSKLISEVNTQQQILDCDVNHREIVVLGAAGTLSVLDMEESTFNVILRSHLDNV